MARLKFGDVEETVITREEFTLEKARAVLAKETIAVIGYGVQGPAQALNLRDNGIKVIIGQRKNNTSYKKAIEDGWKEGETLFSIEEACEKGTIIINVLSDAGQIAAWPSMKERLTAGKALCFSHGFAVHFHEQTKVVVPKEVDLFLIAPKGSGRSVRKLFQEGKGINSSFAVGNDATGRALERACAVGIGIGSGYLFETTMSKEVVSDLVGERGVLMGALAGVIEAQYNVLRQNGHTPSEAFNETVEELTQSLVPLIGENGMDWMFANCSTTAQRGALDWKGRFRQAVAPVFADLYTAVATGKEAERSITSNSAPDYREKLDRELKELGDAEIWRAGAVVRKLRPLTTK